MNLSNKRISAAAFLAGAAIVSLTSADAATYLPVPPVPGSTSMSVFGINSNKTITGGWVDTNGVEHGFVGSLQGQYTTFDYTGSGVLGTEARGINDTGSIVGFAPNANFILGNEFVRDPNGNMTTITKSGSPLDGIAQGITNQARTPFAGDYFGPSGRIAYSGRNGVWQQDLVLPPIAARGAARGMNNAGTIVGYFGDANGNPHGFIDVGGTATQVDYPDSSATGTYLEGISDNGLVTGNWADASGNMHAFTLDSKKGTFTPIVPPGTYSNASVWGLNSAGLIAVTTDAASGPNNFIYCPANCPGHHGIEVPDARSIHKPGGYSRVYVDLHRPQVEPGAQVRKPGVPLP